MTLKSNYKKTNLILIFVFLLTQTYNSKAVAQFEDFPPPPPASDDFEAPPLPEPMDNVDTFSAPPAQVPAQALPTPSPTNSASTPSSFTTTSGTKIIAPTKNAKSSILSEKQKQKFARANPEDITSENFPESIESFDFPNVEITDVIKAISELTGKNFIIDSSVRGKITIVAPSKITVAEAYKAFLSSLAINGFTVVPSGGFLKIRNARSAQRDGIDIYSGSYYPNSDQMITKVIHLKHITADGIKTAMGRLLTSSYGELESYPQTNSLIVSDFGSSIDRIMKIITQLDVPGFEEQLEVVGIKYAKAKDISDLIDKIVNKGQNSGSTSRGGFNGGTPRFSTGSTARGGSGSQAGAASFMVYPEERTNSLIITGNRTGIARVKKLISQLDFKVSPESQGGVYVYYVKHGNAEDIAKTLSEVAKEAAPKQGNSSSMGFGFAPQGQAAIREGLFGGEVSIKADKNTNSLVVSASRTDYDKVLNILNRLDIARDQVFVESIIMEMNMNDGMNSGGGIVQFNKNGGKAGYASSNQDVSDILNPLAGGGSAILGFSSGAIEVNNPVNNTTVKLPNLLGYLKFIKSFGKTNILSTPQIMAMDAQEAEIEVGDRIVTRTTVTTTGTTGNTQEQPEFDDATIKLKIKPFISPASDMIRMEFTQDIKQRSNVQVPSSFAGKVQPLAKRSMKTNLVLNNGDTAVIGGLMKDEEIEQTSKVPVLGDLPILGWLFKSKSVDKTKVNMLVFLTPKIIRNPSDQQALVKVKTDERLKFLKRNGGKDPYGETIDKVLKREARTPQSINNGTRKR